MKVYFKVNSSDVIRVSEALNREVKTYEAVSGRDKFLSCIEYDFEQLLPFISFIKKTCFETSFIINWSNQNRTIKFKRPESMKIVFEIKLCSDVFFKKFIHLLELRDLNRVKGDQLVTENVFISIPFVKMVNGRLVVIDSS